MGGGKIYVDDGAARILDEWKRRLGEGASESEAIRAMSLELRRLDQELRDARRPRRLTSGT